MPQERKKEENGEKEENCHPQNNIFSSGEGACCSWIREWKYGEETEIISEAGFPEFQQ